MTRRPLPQLAARAILDATPFALVNPEAAAPAAPPALDPAELARRQEAAGQLPLLPDPDA